MPRTVRRLLQLACFIAVFLIPAKSANGTDALVVETNYGAIRGEEVAFSGQQYKAFKGIPYAAPPVGNLRFAAPKSPEKWTEVRDATRFGYVCPQMKSSWTEPMGEDCLTLNVYTPSVSMTEHVEHEISAYCGESENNRPPLEWGSRVGVDGWVQGVTLTLAPYVFDMAWFGTVYPSYGIGQNSSKPVLFWIHGGAFIMGGGTDQMYGPQYLIAEDIVIVTINYRLGALGFLTANTADFSGNWGLKDQVAALTWVQENIAHFGGDPSQVTVYGESAGAISVHLHLLSPLSDGLFSKAIVASGAATMGSVVRPSEHDVKYSKNLARLLGATDSDIESPDKMIEFLRKVDAEKIVERTPEAAEIESVLSKPIPFVPVIEAPGNKGSFLTEEPAKLLAGGKFAKVPMIIGVNDLEGAFLLAGLGHDITPKFMHNLEENVCLMLPKIFEGLKESVMERNECPKVAEEISNTYFDGKPFNSSLLNFIYMCGDLLFTLNVHLAQRVHARASTADSQIYSYYFTFDGKWNMIKKIFRIKLPGAAHGEELSYVFKPAFLGSSANSSPEAVTRNRMVRLLANFVKTGNPTPELSDLIPVQWEPATKEAPNTLVIGKELKLENEFLKTRMDLWDKLYEEYTGKRLFS